MNKGSMLKCIFALLISLLLVSENADAQPWSGNLHVTGGGKFLIDGVWDKDEHYAGGLIFDFRRDDWPASAVLGAIYSMGETSREESETLELFTGFRQIWEPSLTALARPFLGFGFTAIRAELDMPGTPSDSEWAYGLWVDGGVYWTFAEQFNFGWIARYSWTWKDVFDEKYQPGGVYLGLLAGVHW
jgi:hypothetical protein